VSEESNHKRGNAAYRPGRSHRSHPPDHALKRRCGFARSRANKDGKKPAAEHKQQNPANADKGVALLSCHEVTPAKSRVVRLERKLVKNCP
jgi:hypothetical protein